LVKGSNNLALVNGYIGVFGESNSGGSSVASAAGAFDGKSLLLRGHPVRPAALVQEPAHSMLLDSVL
jgi:hypothetical protein